MTIIRAERARRPFPNAGATIADSSAQLAKKFLLVHAVLESFSAVDEDHRDLIGIEASDFGVGIDVDFAPCEAATLWSLTMLSLTISQRWHPLRE